MNIKKLVAMIDDLSIPKDEREIALREVRKIERAEGRIYYPGYNRRAKKDVERIMAHCRDNSEENT